MRRPFPARAILLAVGLASPVPCFATLTPAPGWPIESNQANQRLGFFMAPAGDVNNDGYGDVLIVGGETILPSNASVRLHLGGPLGLSPTPVWMKKGLGIMPRPAGVGDINGDGFADIAIGSPGAVSGGFAVYYGRSWGIDTVGITVISASHGGLGSSIAGAGDVNHDGYDDIVVGAPGMSYASGPCTGNNFGAVEVYYGSASGLQSTGSTFIDGCTLGLSAGAELGWSVGPAGDVDGDGYADIVGGAPFQGPGHVYVWYGGPSGIPSPYVAITHITGDEAGAQFGYSVQTAGDINGDGYSDVIAGAPLHDYFGDPDRGHTYVYLGGASRLSTTSFWDETSPGGFPNPGHCGYSVGTAGDLNGDGLADIVMGFPTHSNGQTSEGGFGAFQSTKAYLGALNYIESNEADAEMGEMVTSAGDVNGDGFGDLLVSAPYHTNGQVDEGQVFLYFGGPDRMKSTPWSIPGPIAGSRSAWSVSGAGDVNGDHFDDFISGDPFVSNTLTNEGRVRIWLGGPGGPSAAATWQIFGGQAFAQLGASVARAGDVNGDGYGDVIVGADQYNNTGAAWVYYGPPGSGIPPTQLFGTSINGHFGNPVASAGDVNGDGYGDVIVGASLDDAAATDAGRAFIYLGGPMGLSTTAQIALMPVGLELANAHFGAAVACAGDYNGDGYDDVIVGEPNRDWRPDLDSGIVPQAGAFEVYPGSATGIQAGAIDGRTYAVAGWAMGNSVASAGDVNGDGYADVIVGTPFANSGTGIVDVFAGSPSSSHQDIFFRNGDQASSAFGNSVASAGDINGDGLSDVVVGAVFEDNGTARDAGAVYVFQSPLNYYFAEKWYGNNAFDNFGHVVAGAMDVNGDGFADVASGAPGDDVGGISDLGSANIWFGNAGIGLDRVPFQFNAAHDIQPLGGTDYTGLVSIGSTLRSAGGATRVSLQYEASPAVGSSGRSYKGRSADVWTSEPGPNGSFASTSVRLDSLPTNARYRWRARTHTTSPYFPWTTWNSFERNGAKEPDFRTGSGAAGVEPRVTVTSLSLEAPAPNPASRSSAIEFVLPRAGRVTLGIYDVQGHRVRGLITDERPAGRYRASWDGRDASGQVAPAGVYFYQLQAAGSSMSRRLVWLR
jgi:flagellar hook capping protein FlgD/FG-GAP repeat protein/VCBS repeat protein